MPYVQRETLSGKYLEVEIYPVTGSGRRIPNRNKKEKETAEAQKKLNAKNARKRLTRLMNCNFTERDIFITLTHKDNDSISLPDMEREAKNFFRRLKTVRTARGLPELKYIYVFGKDKKRGFHVHAVVSGDGMTRDEIEAAWSGKGRTQTSYLEEGENGFEGLAVYFLKNTAQTEAGENKRKWRQSRNLDKPIISAPKIVKRVKAKQLPRERKGFTVVYSNQTVNDETGAIYRRTLYKKLQL